MANVSKTPSFIGKTQLSIFRRKCHKTRRKTGRPLAHQNSKLCLPEAPGDLPEAPCGLQRAPGDQPQASDDLPEASDDLPEASNELPRPQVAYKGTPCDLPDNRDPAQASSELTEAQRDL